MLPDDQPFAADLLRLHGHKLHHVDASDACAHLLFLNPDRSCPLTASFVRVRADDVLTLDALDPNQRSVQFLMQQVQHYEPASHVVAGVVFPSKEVLSFVLPRKFKGRRRTSA